VGEADGAPADISGRCEVSDAEWVEEVGDETGRQIRRTHGPQRTATALEEPPAAEEGQPTKRTGDGWAADTG
jgi:hypothetical protein